jgi:regulator of RNase E activity RraA
VRDAEEIDELGLPVFAAGVTHSGPYRTGPGELRGDISIGGSVVSHGDVIVGDSDGIVVVRREDAGWIARLSPERDEMEMGMLALASRGETDYSWLEDSVVIEHVADEGGS